MVYLINFFSNLKQLLILTIEKIKKNCYNVAIKVAINIFDNR